MEATPEDIEGLRRALADARAEATAARALASSTEAVIAALKLEILKLRRELYGQRSERRVRLLEQMELQLEELEATASEDELAAAQAATPVRPFERRRPIRKPFPEHLPRERVVIKAPATRGCCGSGRLAKLGEDVTETLEVVPRQWKVLQTVREKFTCRDCERITHAGALPPDVTRLGGPEPAGDDCVREIRSTPAAQPPERALRARRDRSQPVDAG